MNEKTLAKAVALGYLGLTVLPYIIVVGTELVVKPIAKGAEYIVWKAKIAKGLKEGTTVEENGKYYEKFTVENGPNYGKKEASSVRQHRVIIDI